MGLEQLASDQPYKGLNGRMEPCILSRWKIASRFHIQHRKQPTQDSTLTSTSAQSN